MNYRIANLIMSADDPAMEEAIAAMPEFKIFETAMSAEETPLLNLKYSASDDMLRNDKWHTIYGITANDTDISLSRDEAGNLLLKLSGEEGVLLMRCHPDNAKAVFYGSLHPRLLKFALWMAYGTRALRHGRVLAHSSAVECGGKVYLFLGESGTGKSTHTRLWVEHIPGATLLNDDSPVLSLESEGIVVYGSPWSGKTPCYRTDCFPLGAIVRLSQAKCNEIRRLGVAAAFGALHPSLPPAFNYDKCLSDLMTRIESDIISSIPICAMRCLPDKDAALTSNSYLTCL